MALDQLGIAASIINSAFILILGGAALAFGLAFGLGGKDHASRYLDRMETSLKDTEVDQEEWETKKREQEANKVALAKEAKAATDPIVEKTSPDEKHPYEGTTDASTDFPNSPNKDSRNNWNGRNPNMDDPFNGK